MKHQLAQNLDARPGTVPERKKCSDFLGMYSEHQKMAQNCPFGPPNGPPNTPPAPWESKSYIATLDSSKLHRVCTPNSDQKMTEFCLLNPFRGVPGTQTRLWRPQPPRNVTFGLPTPISRLPTSRMPSNRSQTPSGQPFRGKLH